MDWSEWKKRVFAKGYEESAHKAEYDEVASTFGVDPKLVYRLAHGKPPRTLPEHGIIQELLTKGVLW